MLIPKTRLVFKKGKPIDRLGLVEWEDLDPSQTEFVKSPISRRFDALNIKGRSYMLKLKDGSSIDMNLSNGFTWAIWVCKNSGSYDSKGVVIGNTGTPRLYFEPESANVDTLGILGLTNRFDKLNITFGRYIWKWCVYSASTTKEKLFINGVQVWENPLSPSYLSSLNNVHFNNSSRFGLGHYDNGDSNNHFIGGLFDFVMYEGALDNLDNITTLRMPRGYINHITDNELEVDTDFLDDNSFKLY